MASSKLHCLLVMLYVLSRASADQPQGEQTKQHCILLCPTCPREVSNHSCPHACPSRTQLLHVKHAYRVQSITLLYQHRLTRLFTTKVYDTLACCSSRTTLHSESVPLNFMTQPWDRLLRGAYVVEQYYVSGCNVKRAQETAEHLT